MIIDYIEKISVVQLGKTSDTAFGPMFGSVAVVHRQFQVADKVRGMSSRGQHASTCGSAVDRTGVATSLVGVEFFDSHRNQVHKAHFGVEDLGVLFI
jgi:hypothetical protein